MIHRAFAVVLTLAIFTNTAAAADRETIRTDWRGFRDEVDRRKLHAGRIRVQLTNGKRIDTRYIQAVEDSLRVPAGRRTTQWKISDREAAIPKTDIASVSFTDKRGKGRMIGLIAGTGAGAAAAALIETGVDVYEGPMIIVIPVIATLAVIGGLIGGYYIGRAMDHRGPEFIFTQ